MNKKEILLSLALTSLVGLSANAGNHGEKAKSAHDKGVHCKQSNACAGKGGCKGAKNDCKGHNKCGGHEFTATDKSSCEKIGGKVAKK